MEWTEKSVRAALDQITGRKDPDDPRERTRQRIVGAAAELFIEQGYKKTSVDEIAARAHVAKGTIYAYAKNKASLLALAIAEEKVRNLESLLPILDEKRPPKERLKMLIEASLIAGVRWPLLAKVMEQDREFLFALDQVDERFAVRSEEQRTELHEMLIEAAAPGRYSTEQKREHARVLIALSFFTVMLQDERVRQGLEVERLVALLADMIVDGLAPQ